MDWIVTTARTVEEAQSRALDLLGVDIADAEIQVIEEGKTGLFGRTKSEARVRARIKPKAPPTKDERRPSRNDNRSESRGSGRGRGGKDNAGRDNAGRDNAGRDNAGRDTTSKGQRQGSNSRSGGRQNAERESKSGAGRVENTGGGERSETGRRERADAGSGGGRSRSRSGSSRSDGRARPERSDRSDRLDSGRGGEDRVEMPVAEQRETLDEFVTGVAKAFDADSTVELVEEGTTLQAQVRGSDLGRLIGNKASTLQSLEELARTAMHRAAAGRRYHRIQVDVDDYRLRRREALVRFAMDLAADVARTGKSKAMEPMGAADRKLVHDAVGDIAGVETVSEGRDPRRYIVILPTNRTDEEE